MKVKVVDNAFDQTFIEEMDTYVRTLPFDQTEVDIEVTQLKQGKSSDFDFNHPLIKRMDGRFKESLENSELQRAYCNKIRNTDTPQSHRDSKYDVDFTVLYYVNKNYDYEWGGETIFYDDYGDATLAVTARPGRIVFFPGNILHSARPFLMHVTEPRYTIAFKYVFSF